MFYELHTWKPALACPYIYVCGVCVSECVSIYIYMCIYVCAVHVCVCVCVFVMRVTPVMLDLPRVTLRIGREIKKLVCGPDTTCVIMNQGMCSHAHARSCVTHIRTHTFTHTRNTNISLTQIRTQITQARTHTHYSRVLRTDTHTYTPPHALIHTPAHARHTNRYTHILTPAHTALTN